MAQIAGFDKIELHLVRVLHVLITESSVSRAALKLQSTQPAVSAQLRRLRVLTGDALLVRSGNGMKPTETALALVEPAAAMLREAGRLFGRQDRTEFEPRLWCGTFRVATSDYLDPMFLPELVARVGALAPRAGIDVLSLSGDFDYRRSLAAGDIDMVVGNWLEPPGELHLRQLISDDIVCLVGEDHPAVRNPRDWTVERYLASAHVAPMPFHVGGPGIIDDLLAHCGLARKVRVRSAYFGLIPVLVARGTLVLTTGRQFCSRYVDRLPVRIVPCPVALPPLDYYLLWHGIAHGSAPQRWLREQVREVATALRQRTVAERPGARSAIRIGPGPDQEE